MRRFGLIIALAGALAGCGSDTNDQALPKLNAAGSRELVYQELHAGDRIDKDANVRILLDIVIVDTPSGYLSTDQTFWSLTSPPQFDAGTMQSLVSNDIRAAIIHAEDWPKAHDALQTAPGVMSQTISLAGQQRGMLDTRDLAGMTIFYYDHSGQLIGRTFDDSQTYWSLFYAALPENRSVVELRATPVVRSRRTQLKINRVGEDYEIEHVIPETLLDLGFKTQIPLGTALVLAPTAKTTASSLGRVFLTTDNNGILSDRLIVIYPRIYRYNAKASHEATRKAEEEAAKEAEKIPTK